MSAERKATSGKRSENLHEATKFLWHLQPRYRNAFDHDHWWLHGKKEEGSKGRAPLEAALWEIFRRNPRIPGIGSMSMAGTIAFLQGLEEAEQEILNSMSLELQEQLKDDRRRLRSLAECWCLSWPKLPHSLKNDWADYIYEKLPIQRRFVPGSVIALNKKRLKELLLRKRVNASPAERLAYYRFRSVETLSEDVADCSAKQDKKGKILIAIDPRAPLNRITQKVNDTVREWKMVLGMKDSRKTHSDAWLLVIAEFERHELSRTNNKRRDDQLFAKYRRAIEDWSWPF